MERIAYAFMGGAIALAGILIGLCIHDYLFHF